jgi:hypothetical protein
MSDKKEAARVSRMDRSAASAFREAAKPLFRLVKKMVKKKPAGSFQKGIREAIPLS